MVVAAVAIVTIAVVVMVVVAVAMHLMVVRRRLAVLATGCGAARHTGAPLGLQLTLTPVVLTNQVPVVRLARVQHHLPIQIGR